MTINGTASKSLDILIVGGGLGGLAAAIACRLAGHNVVVLEQASQLSEVGAGIQLSPNVTRLLRRWGLFEALEPAAVQPGNIYFRRWETGEPIGLTRLVPDFEQQFGAPYWVVHRAHLHESLVNRMKELGGVIHVDSRVTDIDFEARSVTTVSGKTYTADLIVGCDGLKSTTRAIFLGQEIGPAETPFCAYRSTVPMDLLLADPDLRPLVEKPDLSLWIGNQRHVMSYPISGGKTFNMVLSHPDSGSNPETQEELLQEMRDNYVGWDKRLTKIISLIDRTSKWKLMTCPRVENWVHPSGTFILMGDACHAMLPYMSQGAAQAIEDAAVLGRCLAGTTDLATSTKLYEKIRKERAYKVQARSALNGRIWHYADGPDQQSRDAGMAASLTNEHYIRCTNQWSDPPTQIWLYNHDAEAEADRIIAESMPATKGEKGTGVQEMIEAGLLAPL